MHAGTGASEHPATDEIKLSASLCHLPDYQQFILQQRLPCFQTLATHPAKQAVEYFCDRGDDTSPENTARGAVNEAECAFKSQKSYLAILFINFFT